MTNRLLKFLDASPVNFLAVKNIVEELEKAGYKRIDAREPLGKVKAGDKRYVTKNDSSVFAFEIGKKKLADAGFHMICAHSDSPTFRIKPNAEMQCEGGMVKLNTEVYGGPIMSTWFDRPLTIAGRVIVRGKDAMNPETRLIHVKRPLMQISNLAIHFNRQVNDGVKLSKQKDVLPLLGIITDELEKGNLLMNVILEELGKQKKVKKDDILDFDLYLADTQPACTFGVHDELISSGRLDDLSMCFAGLEALLASPKSDVTKVLAIFDNVPRLDAEAHCDGTERHGRGFLSGCGARFHDFRRQCPRLASELQREIRPHEPSRARRRSCHQVQRLAEIRQRRPLGRHFPGNLQEGRRAVSAFREPQRRGWRQHARQYPRFVDSPARRGHGQCHPRHAQLSRDGQRGRPSVLREGLHGVLSVKKIPFVSLI